MSTAITSAAPAATSLRRARSLAAAVDRHVRAHSVLVGILTAQAVLLAWLAPYLLHEDTWLTLVAGREVWQEGIPGRDMLAVETAERRWIDQQWLAQLLFYGASAVGGLGLVFALHLVFFTAAVGAAMAVARGRGASQLSVLAIASIALLVAPWTWQPRAQSAAYLPFAALLGLLLSDRGGPRRRTLLVLPLLVVWANLHGSALVGAGIVVAYAIVRIVEGRRRPGAKPHTPLALLLAPFCLLITPYGPATIHYYVSVLGPTALPELAPEWQRPSGGESFVFFALAALTVGLVAARRRRFAAFELVVLLGTLAASLTAVRHFVWFALAAIALLPPVLLSRGPRRPRAANRAFAWGAVGVLAAVVVGLVLRPAAWYEKRWPDRAARALGAAMARDPADRVFVHGREADWLLWKQPSLAGRIAYDARLELLTDSEIRAVVRFDRRQGTGWTAAVDAYRLVWINSRLRPAHAPALRRAGWAEMVYRDREVTLLRRPA